MKRTIIIIIMLLIYLIPMLACAGTYYVRYGATGNWEGATNRATPCSYLTAEFNVAPGDTLIFINDGGDFRGNIILNGMPSGTEGNEITFKGEEDTTVVFNPSSWAIDLAGKSYINIENLTFKTDYDASLWISAKSYDANSPTSYITIRDCTFIADHKDWAAMYFAGSNNNIRIINCTFIGGVGSDEGPNDLVYFTCSNEIHSIHHVLVEGCSFYGGSHASLEFQNGNGTLEYIIIRNNNLSNPNHGVLNVYGGGLGGGSYILIEKNIVRDAGSICALNDCEANAWGSARDKILGRYSKPNIQFENSNSIVRYNLMYNGGRGFKIDQQCVNNRIYNNVFYKNCKGIDINTPDDVYNNIFKNNIFKDNNEVAGNNENYPIYVSIAGNKVSNEWRYNSFDEVNDIRYSTTDHVYGIVPLSDLEKNIPEIFHNNIQQNPNFVNVSKYDFHLREDSPMIDLGDFLTYTKGTGNNSNTIVVDDARYFMDGWDLIEGDLIQLKGNSKRARITNVNYVTNTITIDQNISWSDGQGISLAYRKTAPDVSAYEYLVPPKDLRIVNK